MSYRYQRAIVPVLVAVAVLFGGVGASVAGDIQWHTRDEFVAAADTYEQGVAGLILDISPLLGDTSEAAAGATEVTAYLTFCKGFANTLVQWRLSYTAGEEVRLPPARELNAEADKVGAKLATYASEVRAAVRAERKLYEENIVPMLEGPYVANLATRRAVLDIKYFDPDTDETGNIFEGIINSTIPFLKSTKLTDVGEDPWYRQHGVSKWEATLRVDPIVLANSNHDPGFVLGLGLLFNFFPTVKQNTDDVFAPTIKPTLFSKHLKRVGLRAGGGIQVLNQDEVDGLYGGGIQVRAMTAWALYSHHDEEWQYGTGFSDLDWLLEMIPLFR